MTNPDDVGAAWRALGRQLAGLRNAAGYTQQAFAPLTCYGRSSIANVETGRQHVGREFWTTCDRLLDAHGTLIRGYDEANELARRHRRRGVDLVRHSGGEVYGRQVRPEDSERSGSTGTIGTAERGSPERPDAVSEVDDMRRRQMLNLATAALPGGATASGLLGGLVETLTELTPSGTVDQPPDVPGLRTSVSSAKRNYQSCQYSLVLRQLPDLLRSLHAARDQASADQVAQLDVLLADAYQVAGSIALKFDDDAVAAVAADRSMTAARRSGDPVAVLASTRLITHTLTSRGHHARAITIAEETATHLNVMGGPFNLAAGSVYGALLLRAAIGAARGEDRSKAANLLDEAHAVASRIGRDGNWRWTAFGPANVRLHRVHVAVSLGDAGTAVDHARQIDLRQIPLPERRACLLLDVAAAYAMWGKADRAYRALLAVERTAPQELTARTGVHRLVAGLAHIASSPLRNDFHQLAQRIGAPL